MKAYDVIAMGELLIDFTVNGKNERGNTVFEACPGGAPCNILAMLSKLGRKTSFLGKVGKDSFGRQLRNNLKDTGIDTSHLYEDEIAHTTLAFVHTLADGDREFSFYRNPGADMMIEEQEISEEYICQAEIFHFGTLSMTHEKVRRATKKAVELAEKNGLLITFDPNLRPLLWESLEDAKEQMEYGFSKCDVLKISDNELQFVSGKENYDEGIRLLQEKYKIPLIFLTLGKGGSRAYYEKICVQEKAYDVSVIDTTGAGDAFCGNVIHFVLQYGVENLTEKNLREILVFANSAAAIVTTRKGALCSMPEQKEILALMKKEKRI
ncbi:carbohydrate kinase family protein [Faecalimonas sp.]